MVYIYIDLRIFTIKHQLNVGQYSSPMDPMGKEIGVKEAI